MYAQEETVEIESVNQNQNKKQAGVRRLRNRINPETEYRSRNCVKSYDKHNV